MPAKSFNKALWLLGFVAIAVSGCDRAGRPAAVSTTRPVRQSLASWVSSNGKVEPVDPYIVQSQLTTFIEKVSVKQGDKVARGQTLLTLDAKDLESELAKAKGELFTAEDERKTASNGGPPEELVQIQSDLAKADSEIARLRRDGESLERLYAKQAATRHEIEQNKLALGKVEADKRLLEQRKNVLLNRSKIQGERATLRAQEAGSSIKALQEKLNAARVAAPAPGTVFSLSARAGTFVHTGDVLAEMADLTRIRIRVFVDEPELGLLKEGQTVEFTWDGLPNRMWSGKIEQLPKTIVPRGSRNVGEVLCSVSDTAAELLPNTNVGVRIRTAEKDNSLTVLRSAVRTEANKHYVFVVDQGHLRRRDVTLGISNSTHFEILSGLSENDLIALPGATELQDGASVTVS
jgi:HlyD family secretion protein